MYKIKNLAKLCLALAVFTTSLYAKTGIATADLLDLPKPRIMKAPYFFSSRLLFSLDTYDRTIEMDDGSVWRVEGSASWQNVREWFINDALVLCPTVPSYKDGPRFFLYNQMAKTTAFVEPIKKPYIDRITTYIVKKIDYTQRQVQLIDGAGRTSYWLIDANDSKKLNKWQENQLIVIGYNPNYTSRLVSSLPYILFNTNKNALVYAYLQQ